MSGLREQSDQICSIIQCSIKSNPEDFKNWVKNRSSKYVYDLHELINKMLKKKSNLTYEQVRERYEHFRSRCTKDEINKKIVKQKTFKRRKEKGCTEPLVGKKAKCVLKIVPQENKCSTFEVDKKCIKKRID